MFSRIFGFLKRCLYSNEVILLYRFNGQRVDVNVDSLTEVKILTMHNINDLIAFQSRVQINWLKNQLLEGDCGYLAYFKSQCVHRTMVVLNRSKVRLHTFYSLHLNPTDLFIRNCETAENARGNGVYPSVLNFIINKYRNDRDIFIHVDQTNFASIRGIEKVGFVLEKKIHIRVICGVKF